MRGNGAAPLVSVIVNNYNYARYLPEAIASVTAQTYPNIELLVIDDGSTDSSRQVLARYGDDIAVILQDNAGQAAAMNTGFAASHGDLVLFLDSDDRLHPECIDAVVAAATPEMAKLQFRLTTIDAAGTPHGTDPPWSVELPSGDLGDDICARGRTVCPVTSGNAYPRRTLERIMPIPADDFRLSADGYLNTLAPLYGPVVALDAELGDYRQHGANRWAFTGGVTVEGLHARLEHDDVIRAYLDKAASDTGHHVADDLWDVDVANLRTRLCSLRLDPRSHPFPRDDVASLVRRGVRAAFADPDLPMSERLYAAGSFVAIGAAPERSVARVVDAVASSRPKPAWVRAVARTARRALGTPSGPDMPAAGT